jgi:hypothetical protein
MRGLMVRYAGLVALLYSITGYAQEPPPARLSAGPTFRYASDTPGSAYEWLEREQELAYGESRKPPDLARLREVIKSLPQREGWEPADKILDAAGVDQVTLPTRFENPGGYFLLKNISDSIHAALRRRNPAKPLPEIFWGTLPHGEVNAAAQAIGNENLVLLNEGMFSFLYASLLGLTRTIEFKSSGSRIAFDYSEDAFRRQFSASVESKTFLALLLQAFARPDTGAPDIRLASASEAAIVMRQLNAIERFIVGHEFGHIVAGDVASGRRMLSLPNLAGGWRPVAALARDWGQELRADRQGLELAALARTSDESGSPNAPVVLFDHIAGYAPLLFLSVADALEDVKFCAASGSGGRGSLSAEEADAIIEEARRLRDDHAAKEPPDSVRASLGCRMQTHPPAWVRQALLEPEIDKRFVKPPLRLPDGVSMAKALVRNARAAYDEVRPALRALNAPGSQLPAR